MENMFAIYKGVLIFAVLISCYFSYRWISKDMTKAELQIGTRNALICGAGLLIVVTAFSFIVTRLSGPSFKISFPWSLNILGLICLVWWIAVLIRDYSLAGPLLLDCGPHKSSSYFRITAGLVLLPGIIQPALYGEGRALTEVFYILTTSAFFFVLSYGCLQLRQNGIWVFWDLLRWEKIESYHWEYQTLIMVNTKYVSLLPWKSGMSVPPHLKQQFDKILREHMSSTTSS